LRFDYFNVVLAVGFLIPIRFHDALGLFPTLSMKVMPVNPACSSAEHLFLTELRNTSTHAAQRHHRYR
jgi:hypothetical protein